MFLNHKVLWLRIGAKKGDLLWVSQVKKVWDCNVKLYELLTSTFAKVCCD